MIKSPLLIIVILLFSFLSCKTIPDSAVAVQPFDKSRYLGTWYEIARFDFTFERNLDNTTANYSLKPNGSIKVLNRGFNTESKKWQEAVGKAKFVKADSIAMLKVSFFGPFYGGYNVLAIDDDYKYALICGGSLEYLWILSREKTIPDEVKNNYLEIARKSGYDTSRLLWINHD